MGIGVSMRSAIRTILLILALHAALVTVVAVVLAAVLLYINWSDEPLMDEASRLLAPLQFDTGDDNGYVHLVGMMAPAGDDSLIFARDWIATFGAAETRGLIEAATARLGKPIAFVGNPDELCKPDVEPCLPLVARHARCQSRTDSARPAHGGHSALRGSLRPAPSCGPHS